MSNSANILFAKGQQQSTDYWNDFGYFNDGTVWYETPEQSIVTNGLIINLNAGNINSYPLQGFTWYDLSGNNNNGILTNMAGQPFWSTNGGGSIIFDGTNDYVDCGAMSSLGSNPANSFSVSCWVKKNANGLQTVFEKYQGSAPVGIWGWLLRLDDPANNDITLYMNRSQQTQSFITAAGVLPINIWVNISFTYDGSFGYLYINGIFINKAATVNGTTSTRNFILGYTSNTNGQFLNGNIANVLGYTRALSNSEILQNFNVTRNQFGL